jgi:alpha-ketoglutarate-dependent taurine dioxygenase
MICEIVVDPGDVGGAFRDLIDGWKCDENKVFVLRATGSIDDPRAFYTEHFPKIGHPVPLAEDVTVGDRQNQRTSAIWMEVRYDPRFPDAYRHSANAQPLHTDGSYIPSFPNATLMACVANSGEGGETTFIDADDLVACLQKEDPVLLAAAQSRTIPHARSGDKRQERIIEKREGHTLVNWNYYCVDKEIDPQGREIAERMFTYLQTSALVKQHTKLVKLAPGDAVTWKDRNVLHGRNGFVANKVSERFLWKCAIDVGNFSGA